MTSRVKIAARLGSPASEQSQVLACPLELVRMAGKYGVEIPEDVDALLDKWLLCVTWRSDWRAGLRSASNPDELEVIGMIAGLLPWVPEDWILDHRDALAGYVMVPIDEECRDDAFLNWGRGSGGHLKAKLTQDQVDEARGLRAQGKTLRALAKRYGVGKTTIRSAVRGDTWR
jgi:hypothetical protein